MGDFVRTTTLGERGPEIGAIGLGCLGLTWLYDMGTPRDEAASVALIRRALDLGMNLIDTADIYGPYTSEELVGRALADGYRERAVVATKVGLVTGGQPTGRDNSTAGRHNGRPEHIRASIDASLGRLRTDHVDLYQLHRVDPGVPVEDTWGAMAEAVAAGKARHLGLCEVTVREIERAQAVHPVAAVQAELSLWTRDALPEVLPYCAGHGITFLAFSPLGRGFLTGRFTRFDDIPQVDFRRRLPRFQPDALRANQAIVAGLRQVADRAGATPAQTALAWVLAQGRHTVPIPGTKTPEHLTENAGGADITLTAADQAELAALPLAAGGRY